MRLDVGLVALGEGKPELRIASCVSWKIIRAVKVIGYTEEMSHLIQAGDGHFPHAFALRALAV